MLSPTGSSASCTPSTGYCVPCRRSLIRRQEALLQLFLTPYQRAPGSYVVASSRPARVDLELEDLCYVPFSYPRVTLRAAGCFLLLAAYDSVPSSFSDCDVITIYYLLFTTYYPLPTAYYLLPTTHHTLPTSCVPPHSTYLTHQATGPHCCGVSTCYFTTRS